MIFHLFALQMCWVPGSLLLFYGNYLSNRTVCGHLFVATLFVAVALQWQFFVAFVLFVGHRCSCCCLWPPLWPPVCAPLPPLSLCAPVALSCRLSSRSVLKIRLHQDLARTLQNLEPKSVVLLFLQACHEVVTGQAIFDVVRA